MFVPSWFITSSVQSALETFVSSMGVISPSPLFSAVFKFRLPASTPLKVSLCSLLDLLGWGEPGTGIHPPSPLLLPLLGLVDWAPPASLRNFQGLVASLLIFGQLILHVSGFHSFFKKLFIYLFNLIFFFCLFRAAFCLFVAYGSSQASGWIGAAAASLRHSHSNARSELHLPPTPQLTETLDP